MNNKISAYSKTKITKNTPTWIGIALYCEQWKKKSHYKLNEKKNCTCLCYIMDAWWSVKHTTFEYILFKTEFELRISFTSFGVYFTLFYCQYFFTHRIFLEICSGIDSIQKHLPFKRTYQYSSRSFLYLFTYVMW